MNTSSPPGSTPDFTQLIVRLRPSNARGWPAGQGHHNARHPDSVVDEARALRQCGWTQYAIAAHLGVGRTTVDGWVTGRRRQPAVRIVVTVVAADHPSARPRYGGALDKASSPPPSPPTKGTP